MVSGMGHPGTSHRNCALGLRQDLCVPGTVQCEQNLRMKFDLEVCLRIANSWDNLKIHLLCMLLF